jgi:hypothetical protein
MFASGGRRAIARLGLAGASPSRSSATYADLRDSDVPKTLAAPGYTVVAVG